jgi:L-ascorbate metabolism protein UlaG (beta-lactamase superfamily)
MTSLEVGAYNEKWRDIHIMPEDSIQAHEDLKGKIMFPIHNGTFDLSLHAWYEPFERISILAEQKKFDIKFPQMGELIFLLNYNPTSK